MKQSFFSRVAHLPRWGHSIVLALAFLAVVFAFSAFSFVPAAHAAAASHNQAAVPFASNGQELEVATSAYSVYVVGHNQNGTIVSHCWNTPYYYNDLSGWWWKGTADIYSYNSSGCTNYTGYVTITTVPASQSGNWWLVYVYPD